MLNKTWVGDLHLLTFFKLNAVCTAAQMLQRIERVNLTHIAGDIVASNIEQVRDKQIKQLMAGLDSTGRPLSPKYSEDPWFKKPGAWQRYAAWKRKLFPETPYDTPNLIIVGTYHNSITVNRAGEQLRWGATASFAGSISGKYGDKQLGLNPESKHEVWVEVVRNPLVKEVSSITGIGIK